MVIFNLSHQSRSTSNQIISIFPRNQLGYISSNENVQSLMQDMEHIQTSEGKRSTAVVSEAVCNGYMQRINEKEKKKV